MPYFILHGSCETTFDMSKNSLVAISLGIAPQSTAAYKWKLPFALPVVVYCRCSDFLFRTTFSGKKTDMSVGANKFNILRFIFLEASLYTANHFIFLSSPSELS